MKLAVLSAGLAAALVTLLPATPARAANNVSYVASTGSGTACTRTAPCSSLQNAHDATDISGEINCLDTGPFAGVTISKSITIDCSNAVIFGVKVDASGGAVTLRNLFLDAKFGDGIRLVAGLALVVENCFITGDNSALPAVGILFNPLTPGSQLIVTDTVITNSGRSVNNAGGGIVVNPQAGGSALVVLNRVTVSKNIFGIAADGTGSTGGINMTISDSGSAANSQDGIVAVTPSGGAPISLTVKNSRSVNNNIGIRSIGPNVAVRMDGSTVIGNGTGLSFSGGGVLSSAGNNLVEANGTNGTFSASYALK